MKIIRINENKLSGKTFKIKKYDEILYTDFCIKHRKVSLRSNKEINVVSILRNCEIIVYVFYKSFSIPRNTSSVTHQKIITGTGTYLLGGLPESILMIVIGAGGSGGNGGKGGDGAPFNNSADGTVGEYFYGGGGGGGAGGYGGKAGSYAASYILVSPNTAIEYVTGVNNGRASPGTDMFNLRTTKVTIINTPGATKNMTAEGGIDGANGPDGSNGVIDIGGAGANDGGNLIAGNGGNQGQPGSNAFNVDGADPFVGTGGTGGPKGSLSPEDTKGGGGGGGGLGGIIGTTFHLTYTFGVEDLIFNYEPGTPGNGGNGGNGGVDVGSIPCAPVFISAIPDSSGHDGTPATSIYESRYGFGGCGGGGGGGGGGSASEVDPHLAPRGGSGGLGSNGGDGCIIIVYKLSCF